MRCSYDLNNDVSCRWYPAKQPTLLTNSTHSVAYEYGPDRNACAGTEISETSEGE